MIIYYIQSSWRDSSVFWGGDFVNAYLIYPWYHEDHEPWTMPWGPDTRPFRAAQLRALVPWTNGTGVNDMEIWKPIYEIQIHIYVYIWSIMTCWDFVLSPIFLLGFFSMECMESTVETWIGWIQECQLPRQDDTNTKSLFFKPENYRIICSFVWHVFCMNALLGLNITKIWVAHPLWKLEWSKQYFAYNPLMVPLARLEPHPSVSCHIGNQLQNQKVKAILWT